MSPEDLHDARDAFDAMDDQMRGFISTDEFYTLFLGLGYPRIGLDRFRELVSISRDVVEDENNFPGVIKFLSKYTRNRNQLLARYFSHLDQNDRGFCKSHDLQALANSVGEELSHREAGEMLRRLSKDMITEKDLNYVLSGGQGD